MTFPKLRFARCPRWLGLIIALVGGVAVWRLGEEVLIRRAFARGVDALKAGDNVAAREQFERCQTFWAHVPEVQFFAAQAARRSGDPVAAAGLLHAAEQLGWNADEVALERALIAVTAGVSFPRVEPVLRTALAGNSTSVPEAFAVLGTNYLNQYRLLEVEDLCARWVEKYPTDVAARKLQADVLERLHRRGAARDAFARWAELAPDDRTARIGLIRMMLATQAPSTDLMQEFDRLHANGTTDPRILQYLAQVQLAGGNAAAGIATLDRAIATGKADAEVYTARAKADLDRGEAAAALPFARRAVELDGSSVEALFTWLRCLQQTGATAEAAKVETRWRQTSKDLERVNELGRLIPTSPYSPDLRREMGEIYLRQGHDAEGLRWLESALALKPDHTPTHQTLAEYYSRTGHPTKAAAHRAQIKP